MSSQLMANNGIHSSAGGNSAVVVQSGATTENKDKKMNSGQFSASEMEKMLALCALAVRQDMQIYSTDELTMVLRMKGEPWKRNARVVVFEADLPKDHIGIIWGYLDCSCFGKESKISKILGWKCPYCCTTSVWAMTEKKICYKCLLPAIGTESSGLVVCADHASENVVIFEKKPVPLWAKRRLLF